MPWPPRIKNLWPSRKYRMLGAQKGVPATILTHALAQAHRVQRESLPAVLTLNHLAEQTGVGLKYLRVVVGRGRDPYRVFQSRKSRGGYRIICVPETPLMRVQRWISRAILSQIHPHECSKAYAPESSVVKAAEEHCGARWLIKVDVQSFFESISEIQVYRLFLELGYQPLVSFEMARLCTRTVASSGRIASKAWHNRKYQSFGIENHRNWVVGHLPQGAPTSPMLSNLAMRDFDDAVNKIAGKHGLAYSRYSDDLVFSTESDYSRDQARRFVALVYKLMRERGLQPHRAKTVIVPPGARKIVLGLLVDGDVPRLSRDFRQALEQHLYYIEKFGPVRHAEKRRFKSISAMRRHLHGLISYAASVDSEFGQKCLHRFLSIDWPPEM
jgi:RNA-directed DNA polymerase